MFRAAYTFIGLAGIIAGCGRVGYTVADGLASVTTSEPAGSGEPPVVSSSTPTDALADASSLPVPAPAEPDTAPDAGRPRDAESPRLTDAGAFTDSGRASDAGMAPVPIIPSNCDSELPGTLGVLRFDDLTEPWQDGAGTFSGLSGGTLEQAPGPHSACGGALQFDDAQPSHVLIYDAPEFQLEQGSIDFWLRIPAAAYPGFQAWAGQVVLSRDSIRNGSGHLAMHLGVNGVLTVRQQNGLSEALRCTNEPLLPDTWHHVGVNFGGGDLELFLDGALGEGNYVTTLGTGNSELLCGAEPGFSAGIDGNTNHWVLGAGNMNEAAGATTGFNQHLFGLQLDNLRFTSLPQNFR